MDLLILIAAGWVAWEMLVNSPAPALPAPAPQSANNSLPANLPYAVAQVESGGQQYDANGNVVTSSAGAIGMMQLMPGTAQDLGVDPYDPAQNLAGGTTYLGNLYAQYGGDLGNTLAAYNWGPGNVNRALASGSPYPGSVQTYIGKVMALLGGQG